jgi:hypothetical protein
MTDHARELAGMLGLRQSTSADLPLMIEAAAQAAWSTDLGAAITAGIIAALRAEQIILPPAAVIEYAGIAGGARARKRVADALLAEISPEQVAKLEELLMVSPDSVTTSLAWLKNFAVSPKPDNIRGLIDRLRFVRSVSRRTYRSASTAIAFSILSGKDGYQTHINLLATRRTGGEPFWLQP